MDRRSFYIGVACICAVLIAFSILMSLAISRLERNLTDEVKELTRVIGEHRNEERDRSFQGKQDLQLEAARTRNTIQDACKDDHIAIRERQ